MFQQKWKKNKLVPVKWQTTNPAQDFLKLLYFAHKTPQMNKGSETYFRQVDIYIVLYCQKQSPNYAM